MASSLLLHSRCFVCLFVCFNLPLCPYFRHGCKVSQCYEWRENQECTPSWLVGQNQTNPVGHPSKSLLTFIQLTDSHFFSNPYSSILFIFHPSLCLSSNKMSSRHLKKELNFLSWLKRLLASLEHTRRDNLLLKVLGWGVLFWSL